ncbi:MAG TPA: FAD-dependent oxidoreductase, partial [Spirochaetia bacterium]|nr:FAD-dependent oxidoreductase [Spirochaetia bacterium]
IDLLHDSAAETGKFTYTRDSYDIPYRCLVPKKVGNLIVVGRCISATHEAMAATRVMATCMAEGEAAGAAAALCVRDGMQPLNVNMSELQERLRAQGAYLG